MNAKKEKEFKFNGEKYTLIDLPGLYSIEGHSNEEKIAGEFLKTHKDDLIINILDANNLKNNLKLTYELVKQSYNVVLVVNMVNDFKDFDEKELSKLLGVPIFGIDARKTKSVKILKSAIYDYFSQNKPKTLLNIRNFERNITKITPKVISFRISHRQHLT